MHYPRLLNSDLSPAPATPPPYYRKHAWQIQGVLSTGKRGWYYGFLRCHILTSETNGTVLYFQVDEVLENLRISENQNWYIFATLNVRKH